MPECYFYVSHYAIVRNKIQEIQSDIKNFRERETSSSGIFKNPIWKWILPFLLQDYQPLPTEELLSTEELDANIYQVDRHGESQLHPKIVNIPRQQEAT